MPLRLEVVTIERQVYSADDVTMVIAPGVEGVMGILPRHEPVVTGLKPGVLEIVRDTDREYLAIGGGYMEVRASQVVVLADVAEQSDEIDMARAEAARDRARQALASAPGEADMEKALSSLKRAEARLQVAKMSRTRRRRGDASHDGGGSG